MHSARPSSLCLWYARDPAAMRWTLRDGLAYLDSSATSQTPQPVIDAITRYYTDYRASVHRGVYEIASRATEAYEGARVVCEVLQRPRGLLHRDLGVFPPVGGRSARR